MRKFLKIAVEITEFQHNFKENILFYILFSVKTYCKASDSAKCSQFPHQKKINQNPTSKDSDYNMYGTALGEYKVCLSLIALIGKTTY